MGDGQGDGNDGGNDGQSYLQQQWADDDAVYSTAGWGGAVYNSTAAGVVDPGKSLWLQRLTIGYLAGAVLLLYPATALARRGRKRRKRGAAERRRRAAAAEAAKAAAAKAGSGGFRKTTPTKALLHPRALAQAAGRGTPDTTLLNASAESDGAEEDLPAHYESPTLPPHGRLIDLDDSFDNFCGSGGQVDAAKAPALHGHAPDGPAVTIEMGILGQDLNESAHARALGSTGEGGGASAYVPVALPVRGHPCTVHVHMCMLCCLLRSINNTYMYVHDACFGCSTF
jgi:hypothetical protein